MQPSASIIAVNKKTTDQLCVTYKICPEKYTPRKPGKEMDTTHYNPIYTLTLL